MCVLGSPIQGVFPAHALYSWDRSTVNLTRIQQLLKINELILYSLDFFFFFKLTVYGLKQCEYKLLLNAVYNFLNLTFTK